MTFVVWNYWQTRAENEARVTRAVKLGARQSWKGPTLGKLRRLDRQRRGRVADVQNRRIVTSCGWRVSLRAWHESHSRP